MTDTEPARTALDAPLRRQHREAGDQLEKDAARRMVASALFPSLDEQPATVGRYTLRRRLGAGGMGIVFAAYDPTLERGLAIKLLHPSHASEQANAALLQEAQSAAQLVHPNVVTVFDAGIADARVFLAMELVDGQSMAQWLTSRPPWRSAVGVLAQAARGVAAAHARGIIHRDFKPGNVLLGLDGRVCVADFGLAREVGAGIPSRAGLSATDEQARALTRSGEIVGTPAYMAPEAWLGMVQDERTDQFAFCVALYEVLWGQRPFAGDSLLQLREAILQAEPHIPASRDIPDALVGAVSRGLSKNRRDRFSSMTELATILEAHAGEVDLRRALGQEVEPAAPHSTSMYDGLLRELPDGLHTSPEQRVPSEMVRIALARAPLGNPPSALLPILSGLPGRTEIPAVHARAILSAIYDEHFGTLDSFREFIGEVSLTVIRMMFAAFAVPSPSSPVFVDALVGYYNNLVRGMGMEVLHAHDGAAVIRFSHVPRTANEVVRITQAEVLRASLLAAGCRVAEVEVTELDDGAFHLEAKWQ